MFREQKTFSVILRYFPHKCATFVVPFKFWYRKMLTLTIFTQNRWGVWLKFLCKNLKVIIMCFVEQKTNSVILRNFLTQCAHLCGDHCISVYKNADVYSFSLKSLREYGQNVYTYLKGYYNVFRGTENIFCGITYFPHKCATLWFPLYFGL